MIVQRTGDAMLKRGLTAGGSAIALTWFFKPYVDVFLIWQTTWFASWGVKLEDNYKTGMLQIVTLAGVYLGQYLLQRVVARTSDETRAELKQNEENARLRAELAEKNARLAANASPAASVDINRFLGLNEKS